MSEYKDKRKQAGYSPKTINLELGLLRHAFNLAMKEWGWTDKNPVMMVSMERVDNLRDRWLSDEEEEALLSVSSPWLQDAIVFSINTGLRQGEVIRLTWEHVDLERKAVYIGEQKNKGKDELPLNEKAMEVLRRRARVRLIKKNVVFYSKHGHALEARNLIRAFKSAMKKAGVEKLRWHDLRHTHATRMAHAGVDPYKIQKLMRHKSATMMQRYAHHNVESLRDGVEALDRRTKKRDKRVTNGGFEKS